MRRQYALADLRIHRPRHVLQRASRSGGIRRRLLVLLALFVVIVALLPLLVANTRLRDAVLSAALPADDVRVTAAGASLGWFSAQSLNGVEVKDADGKLLLSAASLSVDRSPLSLLLNPSNFGTIQIIRPQLHLAIRPDGSNLEDVLNSLLSELAASQPSEPDANKPSTRPAYAIHLVDGTIHAEDLATNSKWRIEGIQLQYTTGASVGNVGSGTFAANVVELAAGGNGAAAGAPSGQIAVSLKQVAAGRQELTWQITGLSLAPAEPWLRRFIVASELSGILSGQGAAAWTASPSTVPDDISTSGLLTIDRLDASAPLLNGDRIRLTRVELPWQLAAQPARLTIQDLQLRCDAARIGVRGSVDTTVRSQDLSLANLISNAAAQHNLETRGSLDLASLAAMLPKTLRIRDDTKITSGTLDLAGHCQPAGAGQRIAASLRTSQLAATSAGRALQWERPVNADVQLTRLNTGLRIDSLACESDFLEIAANGTPQDFAASAEFDLNRLAQQLGQFVNLSEFELAGTGEAKLEWKQTEDNRFSARADASLSQLRVALEHGAIWAEPELKIAASADGTLDAISRRPSRVDSGRVQLSAQGDELDARLANAVILNAAEPAWPIAVNAEGRIGRWLTRARPWMSMDDWQIDGESKLTTNIRVAHHLIDLGDTKFSATDFRATSPAWNISEPRLELSGSGRWNASTGEATTDAAQLVTSTVSLAVKNVAYRPPQNSATNSNAQLTGVAAIRADLARLSAWRATPANEREYHPQGELTGNLRFAQQNGRITGELTATGNNLALSQASRGAGTRAERGSASGQKSIWNDPRVAVRALGTYETTTDRLDLNQLTLQSNTLQAAAKGTVDKLSTAANVNLSGSLNYDLAQVTPLLAPYIGDGVKLVGREQARFALAGQLNSPNTEFHSVSLSLQSPNHWSRRVRAQVDLPWSGASVYGLPVGPGRIAAVLGDGGVRVEPLSLAVGEGQLSLAPSLRLDPSPAELIHPAGPLVTNVRISPEVSEAMLKYIAPVLTGATQTEGLFSMQLEATRMPLGEMRRLDSAGKLTVHSVRVVPGELAREWIALAQQIEAIAKRQDSTALATKPPVTLLSIRDQQVNFRVVDGRVHHQNMEFQVGDIVMRSQGSVGLDETLAIMLQVPIQDSWIASQPLLSGLKGQSLQVPISGTLTRPQVDQRAIASLSQQLLQSAAGQAIGGELNKALDKLFKPK
jgi:translocation and assembly module TamB